MTTYKKVMISMLAVFCVPLLIGANALAATVTWDDEGADTIWATAENWDNNQAPSAGNSYVVDGFTVQNPGSDAETFAGDSLSVLNGTLILYRSIGGSSGGTQHNVIPNLSLTDSVLHPQIYYASGQQYLDSPVALAGDNTLVMDTSKCSWTFQMHLTEGLTGWGTLDVYRTDKGSGRTLHLDGDNSDYAGSWTIRSTVAEKLYVNLNHTSGWGLGNMTVGNYAQLNFKTNVVANGCYLTVTSSGYVKLFNDTTSVVGCLEYNGGVIAPGTYTATELNTLTGSSAFLADTADTGTLTVQSLASNPSPFNGEIDVATDADLSWDTAVIPDGNDVTQHQLYISAANDPNMVDIAPILIADDDSGSALYTEAVWQRDATYYWRVDEYVSGDANDVILRGVTWQFDTVLSIPTVDVHPADQFVFPGQPAEFSVEATDPFAPGGTGLSYQWYLDGDLISGATDAVYSITDTQAANEGQYYCKVTCNTNGATADSDPAALVVKRQVANWTFNETLTDTIGGYAGTWVPGAGDPNGVAYEDGYKVETTGEALSLSGTSGHVDMPAAAFENVSEQQISVAVWIKTGSFAKTTLFGAYDGSGNRMISTHLPWNGVIYFDCGNSSGYDRISKGKPLSELQDVWTHMVFTKDIATGEMKIFLNGQQWASGTGMTRPIKDAVSFMIGRGYADNEEWQGAIDEFQIYNYALDNEEIASIYYQYTGLKTCLYPPEWDYTGPEGAKDCVVDLYDLEYLAQSWLENGFRPE